MSKFILWLLTLILGYIWWKHRRMESAREVSRNDAVSQHAAQELESMVACARCGVFFPSSEACQSGEQSYCCPDHAKLGAQHQ
ncbi:PP0621 family protein [Ampullimonas aquatilis]|uniref:PP0621 family protein n=1 Tax=Ampullimonas aquatilis TaxID=1341549 RepID=UPI003C709540